MTIAFRVDASSVIGTGHAVRCLALAEALRARGAKSVFVTGSMPAGLVTTIQAGGHALIELPPTDGQPGPEWSVAVQDADAAATVRALTTYAPTWIIVDHYRLGVPWERTVAASANFAGRVGVIDDGATRAHDCDLLIDHNVTAAAGDYAGRVPDRSLSLLGPRYALLRPDFARPHQAPLRPRTTLRRLLIAFVGADPTGETEKSLRALSGSDLRSLPLDVVVGGANPRLDAIRALALERGACELHVDTDRMASLIERTDCALGAAGVSALERCARGLPALMITLADNQEPIARALAERGAALRLGPASAVGEDLIARSVTALRALPDLLTHLSGNAYAQCDGRGADRVAARICHFDLRLRPATAADSENVLQWRNDESTRRHSRDFTPIDPAGHRTWFAARLADPQCALLIAEDAQGAVGVLRYDIADRAAYVSIYLVPGRHGEGLGASMLHAGHRWLRDQRPEVVRIDAEVKSSNHPSRLAFEETGYAIRATMFERPLPR
jgi:UDP-2,4-diacetamido-2,4,6-trideoxy-beta-L-altropyranose hydrolase